ncbi:hypothetical protein CL619_00240 [archaeon]|nr:hypothetical protein [archaeon]
MVDTIPSELYQRAKDWTFQEIIARRLPGKDGIPARVSKFNRDFRLAFRLEGLDPVAITARMKSEGLLRIHPAKHRADVWLFPTQIGLDCANLEDLVGEQKQEFDGEESSEDKRKNYTHKTESRFPNYDYPAKNSWRENWIRFLGSNLSVGPNTRILTFLAPQALELPQYDSLGIRRENIVCVERDREYFATLEDKQLGVDLHNTEMSDFLQKTDCRFDAILLDYDGGISEDVIKTLELIVDRGLLRDQSVLGLNLFDRRESEERKMLYLEPFLEQGMPGYHSAGVNPARDILPPTITASQRDMNGIRDYGITAVVLKLLLGKDATRINQRMLQHLPWKERESWKAYIASEAPKRYVDFIRINDELREYLQVETGSQCVDPMLMKLAVLSSLEASRPYFVTKQFRSQYLTEAKNNGFYSDFFALDTRREDFRVLDHRLLTRFARGQEDLCNLSRKWKRTNSRTRKRISHQIRGGYDDLMLAYDGFFVGEHIPERARIL